MWISMIMGIPLGVPIGLALGNIGLGPGIGAAMGIAVGIILESSLNKNPRPLTEQEQRNIKRLTWVGVFTFLAGLALFLYVFLKG